MAEAGVDYSGITHLPSASPYSTYNYIPSGGVYWGRGYQPPPGSSGSASVNPAAPAKGMTGTSVQQDPKATPVASGPIV